MTAPMPQRGRPTSSTPSRSRRDGHAQRCRSEHRGHRGARRRLIAKDPAGKPPAVRHPQRTIPLQHAGHQVHPGERGDEPGARRPEHPLGGTGLDDPPLLQDRDAVGEHDGVEHIVGDEDGRRPGLREPFPQQLAQHAMRSARRLPRAVRRAAAPPARAASARAIATRCCWPPDSCAGLAAARSPSRPTAASQPRGLGRAHPAAACPGTAARTRRCRSRSGAGRAAVPGRAGRHRGAPAATSRCGDRWRVMVRPATVTVPDSAESARPARPAASTCPSRSGRAARESRRGRTCSAASSTKSPRRTRNCACSAARHRIASARQLRSSSRMTMATTTSSSDRAIAESWLTPAPLNAV